MTSAAETKVTSIDEAYELPAPPARVFAAWTDARELVQWLAQHVRIEPHVGGAFRFWGRHTPWVPRESDADGLITRFDPDTCLDFRWTLRACPCETTLRFDPAPAGTTLRLSHTATGELWPVRESDAPWVLKDFWKVMIGNLRCYLRTGKPAITPDFTVTRGNVVLSIDIDAPASRVYAALVDPNKMNQWLAKSATVSPVAGGAYSYGWTDASGTSMGPARLIELIPNRVVEHDWHYANEPDTRVRWELEELSPTRTRVTLTHTKLDDEAVHGGYSQGWAAFLVSLKELAETILNDG